MGRAAELVALGNAAADRGSLDEAENHYRSALAEEPSFGAAHRCLGIVLAARGSTADAIAAYRKAIALDPADAASHCNLGLAYLETGALPDAEQAFRNALAVRRAFPEAWVGIAEALEATGRGAEALAAFDEALALQPQYTGALLNSASLLRRSGKAPQADARLRTIDLGTLLEQGRHDEAEWAAREIAQQLPGDPHAWRILGAMHAARREFAPAADAFARAASLAPDDAETQNNLGICLHSLGRDDESEQALRRALQSRPGQAETHDNLANALFAQGRFAESEASCRRAIELKPGFAAAYSDLGRALDAMGRAHEALQSYRSALDLDPSNALAHNNLSAALVTLGRLDEAEASCRRALALDPSFASAHDNLLAILNFQPDKTSQQVYRDYLEYDRLIGEPLRAAWRPHANDRRKDRRLRVGYVSADLRKHAVANFVETFFDHHDRRDFEVFAYSGAAHEDEVTARFKAKADGWIATNGMGDAALAERIRADGIDILIDLAGHTKGNRLTLFARKPAPVSATTIGFVYTTGLSAMDWILTDANVFPRGAEDLFSERPWRLPIYQAYRPGPGMGDPNELPALTTGRVTFGTLTRAARLNPRVIRVWCDLLRRLPQSRLCIDSLNFRQPSSCEEVAERFAAHGIERSRLDIGFHSPPWDRMRTFDVSLDCFPQNSGTTLFDSLWLGIPFVTLKDRPSLGRLGETIALAAGHPEWVAESEADYVEKAVRLASDLPALAGLRKRLRNDMQSSVLMDEKGYVRAVEAAYREMWARWCADAGTAVSN